MPKPPKPPLQAGYVYTPWIPFYSTSRIHMPKIELVKKEFISTGAYKDYCCMCGEPFFRGDKGWSIYYVGQICLKEECSQMVLLQYADYII